MKIEWSPRAERELTQLRDYIAQDSPFYARQFAECLIQSIERLTAMPRSGRMVPEAGHRNTIREMIFQGYPRLSHQGRTTITDRHRAAQRRCGCGAEGHRQ